MSKIGDLIIVTQEAGYDAEKMTIEEMLELRNHGRILDQERDFALNIDAQEENWRQEEDFRNLCIKASKEFEKV